MEDQSGTPAAPDSAARGGTAPRWMWPAFVITSAGFLVGLAIDSEQMRVAFKALPVLVLCGGVLLSEPRTILRRTVAIGLAFGAAGDLLLELDVFVAGLVSFLVGHVVYVATFLRLSRRLKWVLGVPYMVFGIGLTAFVAEGAGDLLVPVAAYALVISVMGWRGAALVGEIDGRVAGPFAVGAGLFIVSDALIAINRFHTDIPGDAWWIMLSYLAAQGLIALGAVRSGAS